nr:hypothetical protein BCU55_05945 [Shewanella sp. 10N.286.48.A6]
MSLTGRQASFRRAMDGPSGALAFSNKSEAVYKRSQKLDQSPSKIMRFSAFFVRGAGGYPKGEQALFPFWSGVGEAPRL